MPWHVMMQTQRRNYYNQAAPSSLQPRPAMGNHGRATHHGGRSYLAAREAVGACLVEAHVEHGTLVAGEDVGLFGGQRGRWVWRGSCGCHLLLLLWVLLDSGGGRSSGSGGAVKQRSVLQPGMRPAAAQLRSAPPCLTDSAI